MLDYLVKPKLIINQVLMFMCRRKSCGKIERLTQKETIVIELSITTSE